jgi:hypothetical protein
MPVGPRWTNKQEDQLRALYPAYPRSHIEEALAPHSWGAIRVRACELKVARQAKPFRDWKKIAEEHKPTFAFAKDEC